MLAKKTSKNQLTLPKKVVRSFPEIEYFDVSVKERKIILTPVRISSVEHDIEVIRDKVKKLGITEKDVKDAVTWARRKSR